MFERRGSWRRAWAPLLAIIGLVALGGLVVWTSPGVGHDPSRPDAPGEPSQGVGAGRRVSSSAPGRKRAAGRALREDEAADPARDGFPSGRTFQGAAGAVAGNRLGEQLAHLDGSAAAARAIARAAREGRPPISPTREKRLDCAFDTTWPEGFTPPPDWATFAAAQERLMELEVCPAVEWCLHALPDAQFDALVAVDVAGVDHPDGTVTVGQVTTRPVVHPLVSACVRGASAEWTSDPPPPRESPFRTRYDILPLAELPAQPE